MQLKNYTQQDTSILKGIAIISICLHNFFHHFAPYTGENEFYFVSQYVHNFFNHIKETPSEFIKLFFTYLGHYGVQIFIFISGYGLTVSMLKRPKTWLSFVIDRLKKLYPLLLTGIIFFILINILINDRFPWKIDIKNMKYKLLFIHTLLPKQGLSINGPWWFFGLIFQFYLIFPALFHFIKKYNTKAFLIICLFSYAWIFLSLYNFQKVYEVYLLQNFPGHLPEFCLGMLLAFNKDFKINNIFFFLSIIVFCLGNFYKVFFPFTFLSTVIIFTFIYQFFKNLKFKRRILKNFLVHIGNVSMTLFVIHGFMRQPFIKLTYNVLTTPLEHLYAGFLFILTAYLMSFAALHLYNVLIDIFNRIKTPTKQNTKSYKIISKALQISLVVFSIFILYYIYSQTYSDKKDITSEFQIEKNKIVDKNTMYTFLSEHILDNKYKSISVEGELDIKSLDSTAKAPYLVMEIKGIMWEKVKVPENYNASNYSKLKFSYKCDFLFTQCLKNKKVKLFMWNPDKGTAEVNNVNFKVYAN